VGFGKQRGHTLETQVQEVNENESEDLFQISTSLYRIIKEGRAKFSFRDLLTVRMEDFDLNFKFISSRNQGTDFSKIEKGPKCMEVLIPLDMVPLAPAFWGSIGFEIFAHSDEKDYYFEFLASKIFANYNFIEFKYSIIEANRNSDIYILDRQALPNQPKQEEPDPSVTILEKWDGMQFRAMEPDYLSPKDFEENKSVFTLHSDLKKSDGWSDAMIRKYLGQADYLIDTRGFIRSLERADDSRLIHKAYWSERVKAVRANPDWVRDKEQLERSRSKRIAQARTPEKEKHTCILCETANAMRQCDTGWQCRVCGFETRSLD
jgi:hypothetical protein